MIFVMETNKYSSLDSNALKKEVLSLRKELFNLKLSKVSGQVKDFSQFKKLRKNIARCLTVLCEKSA